VAPEGVLIDTSFTFIWRPAPGATHYFVQVNDAATAGKLVQWYTADQAACASGGGTCTVTVTLGLAPGPGTWWILPWNPEGNGPWTNGLQFTVVPLPPSWAVTLPAAQRFHVVLGGTAVLDRETGLVWDRSPDPTTRKWLDAQIHCNQRTLGNRKGYRVPILQELASLIDPTVANPSLPPGHPFTNISSNFYWSGTTFSGFPSNAWSVSLGNGNMNTADKGLTNLPVWCVRGAQGVDPQ
jgi:hypothetical protein